MTCASTVRYIKYYKWRVYFQYTTEHITNDVRKCSALQKTKLCAEFITSAAKKTVTHNTPILLISFCYMFRLVYIAFSKQKTPALYISRNM